MPPIVCNDCGTRNELPITFQVGDDGQSFFYCRGCANRVVEGAENASDGTLPEDSAPAAPVDSGDLLDELLGLSPVTHAPPVAIAAPLEPRTPDRGDSWGDVDMQSGVGSVLTNGAPDDLPWASTSQATPSEDAAPAASADAASFDPGESAVLVEFGVLGEGFVPGDSSGLARLATDTTGVGESSVPEPQTGADGASRQAELSLLGEATVLVEPGVLAEPASRAEAAAAFAAEETPLPGAGVFVKARAPAEPAEVTPAAPPVVVTPTPTAPVAVTKSTPAAPPVTISTTPSAAAQSAPASAPAVVKSAPAAAPRAATVSSAAAAPDAGASAVSAPPRAGAGSVLAAAPPRPSAAPAGSDAAAPPSAVAPSSAAAPPSAAPQPGASQSAVRRESLDELSWDLPPVEPVSAPTAKEASEPAAVIVAPIVPLSQPTAPPSLQASIEAVAAKMREARGGGALVGFSGDVTQTLQSVSQPTSESAYERAAARLAGLSASQSPIAPVRAPGRSMQPTLPFGLSVPPASSARSAVLSQAVDSAEREQGPDAGASGSFEAVLEAHANEPEAEEPRLPLPPEAPVAPPEAGVNFQRVEAAESREWPYTNAPQEFGTSKATGARIASGSDMPELGIRSSDTSSVQGSSLPEFQPNQLKRFAPLGAALVAVVIAFFVGLQIGKMSPNVDPSPPPSAKPKLARVPEPATPTPTPNRAAERAPSELETDEVAEPVAADPAPPARVSAGAKAFNAKAADQAVAKAGARAKACKKPGNPGGTAAATVTFGASGRVEDAVVTGARIGGTPMAACIAATLRSARIAAFSGPSQAVKKNLKFD